MSNSKESFLAFFSYVQGNDEHDRGKLTFFRKLLQAELWAQTGKDYLIFQDIENIEWGQRWNERIKVVLDTSSILIAIITPSYLVSQSCRFEFNYFLEREKEFGSKLILPILYIDTPSLNDKNDFIAVEVSKRQWIDWRDLRFASPTSAKVNKKLESLAKQIRELIKTDMSNQTVTNFPPNSVVRANIGVNISQIIYPEQGKIPPSHLSLDKPGIKSDRGKNSLQLTILLRSTGDKERDNRRTKAIYGTLISFSGKDLFSFQVFENGKGHLIDFPNDTTRVCPELLARLLKLIGEEAWRIEEIPLQ